MSLQCKLCNECNQKHFLTQTGLLFTINPQGGLHLCYQICNFLRPFWCEFCSQNLLKSFTGNESAYYRKIYLHFVSKLLPTVKLAYYGNCNSKEAQKQHISCFVSNQCLLNVLAPSKRLRNTAACFPQCKKNCNWKHIVSSQWGKQIVKAIQKLGIHYCCGIGNHMLHATSRQTLHATVKRIIPINLTKSNK